MRRLSGHSLALLAVAAALLLLTGTYGGPDFGHYSEWVWVFRSGDIAHIRGDVLSPSRVPLSQWSFGPGLILAAVSALRLEPADFNTLAAGWVMVLVFWIVMARVLNRVTSGDRPLTLFGLALCFAGTHVGFYSTAISSEALSYPCLALAVLAVIETERWGPLEALTLAVPCALLLTVRSQLGLYVVPLLATAAWSMLRSKAARPQKFRSAVALAAPLFIAVAEIAITNRWMTGSPLRSPYTFGNDAFKSVDLARPEIAAVLISPWHGLLAYHPLFAVLLAIPFVMAFEQRPPSEKWLLLGLGLAALGHLYLHAAWYVWWLGTGTFGLRGMGISAVVLVPILCKYISERRRHGSVPAVVILVLLTSMWSALLMMQGQTQFFAYDQLWLAQVATARNVLVHTPWVPIVIICFALAGWWLYRTRDGAGRAIAAAAYGLAAVVLLYLVRGWNEWAALADRLQAGLPIAVVLGASGILLERLTRRWQQEDPGTARLRPTTGAAFVIVFLVSTVLFIRAAVRTETAVSRRTIELGRFNFQSDVYLKEVVESYNEYHRIGGFSRKKAALRHFIDAAVLEGRQNLERERAATNPR